MEHMTNEDWLKEIVGKNAKLTTNDKDFVVHMCKFWGVPFQPKNTRCRSCYQDAAMSCIQKIKNARAKDIAKKDERRFVLKPDVDVFFGNLRINEATLTDELAEKIIAKGFETKYFVKCE